MTDQQKSALSKREQRRAVGARVGQSTAPIDSRPDWAGCRNPA